MYHIIILISNIKHNIIIRIFDIYSTVNSDKSPISIGMEPLNLRELKFLLKNNNKKKVNIIIYYYKKTAIIIELLY